MQRINSKFFISASLCQLYSAVKNHHKNLFKTVVIRTSDCGYFKTCTRCLHRNNVINSPLPVQLPPEEGMFKKFIREFKWQLYVKEKRNISSMLIYEACADNIDFREFFTYCQMPDTFLSWFLIIELHVWMCMARMMDEGSDGRYIRNQIVTKMWEDVGMRIKILGKVAANTRKEGMEQLLEHFYAAILAYDEGLLSNDAVLAGAVWRTLFTYRCNNPCMLETVVHYIRKQILYLECMSLEDLHKGNIRWSRLKECQKSYL